MPSTSPLQLSDFRPELIMVERMVVLAALLVHAATGVAQKVPARPQLPATADTNDARAYHALGAALLPTDPDRAADAFHWATRIDPALAESYYGRYVAFLLHDPRRLWLYDAGVKRVVDSREIQRLDSLFARAVILNPAVPLRYGRLLAIGSMKQAVEEYNAKQHCTMSPGLVQEATSKSCAKLTYRDEAQLNSAFDRSVSGAPHGDAIRARMYQADGDYSSATAAWALAIGRAKNRPEFRAARGRLYLQIGQSDSAIADFRQALKELRTRDKKDFVAFYSSKAMLEFTLGLAHQQARDDASAREAFGRALQEDLAFYPAHVRLGYLALDQHDTTTALSELDLAMQLRPDDGLVRDQYGYALYEAGKTGAAIEQLKKALELEPYFALPWKHLGDAYLRAGRAADASHAYRSFLSMARREDPLRAEAQKHLAVP